MKAIIIRVSLNLQIEELSLLMNGMDPPKVIVLVADGSEELETVTIVDILRRANIKTLLVSIAADMSPVKCSRGIHLVPDAFLVEANSICHETKAKNQDTHTTMTVDQTNISIAIKSIPTTTNKIESNIFAVISGHGKEVILLSKDISVILPGGADGMKAMCRSKKVLFLVQNVLQYGTGFLGAICAAPMVLLEAVRIQEESIKVNSTKSEVTSTINEILSFKITSYPSFEKDLSSKFANYSTDPVVIDGRLITSRGPGTTALFALTLVEAMCGKNVRSHVSAAALFE